MKYGIKKIYVLCFCYGFNKEIYTAAIGLWNEIYIK